MLRLFAALPIPDEIADRLVPLQRDLPGASWRPREAFHLTLRFFGEIDEAQARDLDDELGRIRIAPFELKLKGAGSFGGREPAAAWAGVEASPELARLAAKCETASRNAGLAPEPRKFIPHVTLAYLKGTLDIEVAKFQQRLGAFETETFWATHFAMYSSWQTKRANSYVEEAVYPLGF